ncbi:hypothetical protein GWI33_007145 [Rhynchophorus ferrugineus]|uniref:Uncharacterized protein n=1 Tax=Rhynchophorus ferrugineus TaxID=354439 RepID=A0A834MMN8_RHYFE|nr:hypothetical protein GWI33_007145 [Rhynchophorus ferrugineus]
MLKFFILSCLAVAVCNAVEPVPILSQDSEVNPDGSYRWSYQSGDGSAQQQTGQLKQIPGSEPAVAVQGSATWYDPEGNAHQLTYTADENGYLPQSADIPPIPLAILRALEWNAAHPEEESLQ